MLLIFIFTVDHFDDAYYYFQAHTLFHSFYICQNKVVEQCLLMFYVCQNQTTFNSKTVKSSGPSREANTKTRDQKRPPLSLQLSQLCIPFFSPCLTLFLFVLLIHQTQKNSKRKRETTKQGKYSASRYIFILLIFFLMFKVIKWLSFLSIYILTEVVIFTNVCSTNQALIEETSAVK